jgi:cystathionine beta-lyase/cystathionine gamma-synthase
VEACPTAASGYQALFDLICMHPPSITHEHMTSAARKAADTDDGLIRLCVGLENPPDIIADPEQALAKV